jgi:Fe-S cluster assembly scaffold protein SufB
MEQLKLNETPVRTSRNFNINNIKLDNIEIPKNINGFENVYITGETNSIKVEQNTTSNCNLEYGLGDVLTKQVKENANQKLKVNIESKANTENQITFKFDEKNTQLVDYVEILANDNTKGTVIIKYETSQDINVFHNGIIKVQTGKNSKLHIIIANFMNTKSNNFISIQNDIEESANVKYTIVDFGGKNSITNYYSNLKGNLCQNSINAIYIGKEDQVFDLNYIGELRGEKTNIDIEVEGALKDNAKKHFKGTIDFKKGCKKATGNENENCMLLSDTAKSIALPMLLCSEEEVEGNHSSSAGKVGDKELFYIMSRGFEKKEAMKLMVRARFNKILESIKNEELKEQVISEINERLD